MVSAQFIQTLRVDIVIEIKDLELPPSLEEFSAEDTKFGSAEHTEPRAYHCQKTDFSNLHNIHKLATVGLPDIKLPSELKSLSLVPCRVDCNKNFGMCPKLEVLEQVFVEDARVHGDNVITIPSSLKEISWTHADIQQVAGGGCVERFTLKVNRRCQTFFPKLDPLYSRRFKRCHRYVTRRCHWS